MLDNVLTIFCFIFSTDAHIAGEHQIDYKQKYKTLKKKLKLLVYVSHFQFTHLWISQYWGPVFGVSYMLGTQYKYS